MTSGLFGKNFNHTLPGNQALFSSHFKVVAYLDFSEGGTLLSVFKDWPLKTQ